MIDFELTDIDNTLLDLALREDLKIPFTDVTTQTLLTTDIPSHYKIISKHYSPIVVCGTSIINALLKKFESDFELISHYHDGQMVQPKEIVMELKGDGRALLMAERTLLNFLRHLSAIATLTRQFVDRVRESNLKILDTRKTTPGMRHLEKYAVACGGGVNHRMGLYDAYMIKDTHIDLLGGLKNVLVRMPDKTQNSLPVIAEIRTLDELNIALTEGKNKIDRVLLDNMPNDLLKTCVEKSHSIFETEASGNITLETITNIAQTGVDFASIGMITYQAGQVDLSMQALVK